jgi:hypothetical protein
MIVTICVLSIRSSCAAESTGASGGPVPVELVQRDGRYMLLRGGEPYTIKGAGIDGGNIAAFAAHGGTSFRTWRTDDAARLLDEAGRLGLTVILCIDIGRERQGFDYNDANAVAAQLEFARGEVLKYKDHPALLAWMIGNEANLFFENPRVFDAIGEISDMIHDVDGNHPTTTALAGFTPELAQLTGERASGLDFVSIQLYGDIVYLPQILDKIGYKKPFLVTEWGAVGHWEVPKTTWGAPIEQTSSEKADHYLESYRVAIASIPRQIFGSYVFLWGQKQERTPTWYGMFLADGSETEAIDVMHYIWNGRWPANRSPRLERMTLGGKSAHDDVRLIAGAEVDADVGACDPDEDRLSYRWELMHESSATQSGGDREEIPDRITGRIDDPGESHIVLSAPDDPGAYRLFVYIHDGNGHAAHANIPFFVDRK